MRSPVSLLLLLPVLLRSAVAYTTLSDSSLQSLPQPDRDDFDINSSKLLSPILRPRVPGTPGSEAVLFHLVDFFASELPQWKLTFQNSSSTTPTSNGKEVPFTNLIATRDPPWVKTDGEVGRLALVAHYDSKLTPDGFIGATDSAAPCAMLLHAARSIDAALTQKWDTVQKEGGDLDMDMDEHQGVQVILLDGEEAFMTWTHTDSLYGARALADEWESTFHPAMSTYQTPLASIDLFVLLDLLGAKHPKIPSYFKTTHWAYKRMAELETRLRSLSMFKSDGASFFPEADKRDSDRWLGGYIEDDHIPFMAKGVEVLHIIPSPFPRVWHTIEDDGEHLDIPTVEDWAVLTAAFAAEWMDLEGYVANNTQQKKAAEERRRQHVRNELGGPKG